ncbi:3211_t:CDS:2 [Paraglomus occultum]|uniref:3211_t:CDS:1 n=1 Tax=Paraglomus occultum TaxID=144539 RepID=A0A9N9CBT3_9GLOM|nr:3211_t:CDS:2 [Paraglomus occultum]
MQSNVRPIKTKLFVQQLKGSLDGWPLETTVGILVANGANRFTKDAVSAAQSSRYHIILVGINDLIKTIRDYQPQRPVQPLEKEIEETHSEVQQVRSEIAELRDLLISFSKNK